MVTIKFVQANAVAVAAVRNSVKIVFLIVINAVFSSLNPLYLISISATKITKKMKTPLNSRKDDLVWFCAAFSRYSRFFLLSLRCMNTISSKIEIITSSLPCGVSLVAVSKFHPNEAIVEAYNAGQRIFGESRVQELLVKQASLPQDIEWHMIGHLQTNKVRSIVPFVSLIQSVDSQRLLECINREAERIGRVVDILLEIHIAQEESKSGWEFEELLAYIRSGALAELKSVRVRGVMGMATNTDDECVVRSDFERLATCKSELQHYFGAEFDTLSMGMSDDYPIAIECGSTMVRVGSSIFGIREY